MLLLKRISDFILFSNVFVALGAVGITYSTMLQQNIVDNNYLLLVFFATLFVYNFQRIFYKSTNTIVSVRRTWLTKHQQLIKVHAAIGLVGTCIVFWYNKYQLFFYLSPLLILSILYFIPFIKLRKYPYLKLFTLALVWTMVTATTPLLLANSTISASDLLHIVERFFFMIAICIPFDIRDFEIDKTERVQTIVHQVGVNKAKLLAFVCIFVSTALINTEFITGGMSNSKMFTALIVSTIVSTMLIALTNSKRGEYFYVAGIDGTMLIQGVLVWSTNWV